MRTFVLICKVARNKNNPMKAKEGGKSGCMGYPK